MGLDSGLAIAGLLNVPEGNQLNVFPEIGGLPIRTLVFAQIVVSKPASATGKLSIEIVCAEVCVQYPLETVTVTVFEPPLVKLIPPGFSEEETLGIASCPKSQWYDHEPPVLPVLVK